MCGLPSIPLGFNLRPYSPGGLPAYHSSFTAWTSRVSNPCLLPHAFVSRVSCRPVNRLRHWCSSRYLRISPLTGNSILPLRLSKNRSFKCSCGLSPQFFASDLKSRLPPLYAINPDNARHLLFRGFCYVVRQGIPLQVPFTFASSLKGHKVYNPKAFFPHAASLGQAFAHCPIFPTAASVGVWTVSPVPMWPFNLSVRLLIVGLVSRYLTNYLIGRESICKRLVLASSPCESMLCGISNSFPLLSPLAGRLLTPPPRPPLIDRNGRSSPGRMC